MKHTTGKWFYNNGSVENGEHIICSMNMVGNRVTADAALIAAAPDMLEALEYVNEIAVSVPSVDISKCGSALTMMQNAIKKARGGDHKDGG